MADVLNFNPNRDLGFDPNRALEFDPGRSLDFDPGRSLTFAPNRDLGFGRRGVVFRGYICPICGALATEDAPKCTECGAVFEAPPRAHGPSVPASAAAGGSPPKARQEAAVARATEPSGTARARDRARFCAFCGATLKPTDAFCWNCGARSVGGAEAVRLPSARRGPTTREWRGPGEP